MSAVKLIITKMQNKVRRVVNNIIILSFIQVQQPLDLLSGVGKTPLSADL